MWACGCFVVLYVIKATYVFIDSFVSSWIIIYLSQHIEK